MKSRLSNLATLRLLFFAVLSAIVWCGGCGDKRPQTYVVQGKVEFSDSEPVRLGYVEFRSNTLKINARGKIANDGTFQLSTFDTNDGAVAGEHQIVITQVVAPPAYGGPNAEHTVDHGAVVDTKFSDYSTSELSYTVKADAKNNPRLVVERAKVQPPRPVRALQRKATSE